MKPSPYTLPSFPDLWQAHRHPVWLASSLTLRRNLSKLLFPSVLNLEKQKQACSWIEDAVRSSPHFKNPKSYRGADLNFIEKELILEHFLSYDGFQQTQAGGGFILDDTGELLVRMNMEDHLQITVIDTAQELEAKWNFLAKIEGELSKKMEFAFHSRFGFLTANPQYAGTALSVVLFLHIPAIIHSGELSDLLERQQEDEVSVCGLQGNVSEMIGDVLVVRNRCALGLAEEYLLTSMRMWATKTVVLETAARKKIIKEGNETLKNKITRALGLLTHSYQLETIESLNALSLVKLGVDLGWILCSPEIHLIKEFFSTRRAHLLHSLSDPVPIPELPKKRAEHLHEIAQGLQLHL